MPSRKLNKNIFQSKELSFNIYTPGLQILKFYGIAYIIYILYMNIEWFLRHMMRGAVLKRFDNSNIGPLYMHIK